MCKKSDEIAKKKIISHLKAGKKKAAYNKYNMSFRYGTIGNRKGYL